MTSYDSDKAAKLHRELHSHLPPEPALRLKALETVSTEKGFLAPGAVDKWLDNYSENVGPMNGARVIARAWTDPVLRQAPRTECNRSFCGSGADRSP